MQANESKPSGRIREIEAADNAAVERVIRSCLVEFGANHAGTAWEDPDLCRFSEVYSTVGNRYWVAEDARGKLVGGVGIGCLSRDARICELQKMYCLPEARGTGLAHALLTAALSYARAYYDLCYLETMQNMVAAQKFYEKHGFVRVEHPPVRTAHYACDVFYIRKLKE